MVTKQKYVVQQRGYYTGGKGYTGAWCRRARVAPGRVYGNLSGAIRDAALLTEVNDKGWTFVVYPFISTTDRQKTILETLARLPKDENGKPRFRTEGAWNCQHCGEEGFILNEKGYFEPCPECEGTGVLKGEWE